MKRAVCLLDKRYPPDEAFIDGLLCPRSRRPGGRVYVVVARGSSSRSATRWKGSPCLAVLPPRSAIGRLLGFIACVRLLVGLRRRWGDVGDVAVLARNDPSYLAAALIGRWLLGYGRVVHQNTFPHEQYFRGTPKGTIATWLLRRLLPHVDTNLLLTPEARKRLEGLGPVRDAVFIPMCVEPEFMVGDAPKPEGTVKLLYLGTHAPARGLDAVFAAAAEAHRRGARFELTSVGGSDEEIRRLEGTDAVRYLTGAGVLNLAGRVARDLMPGVLRSHHVGLSFIPPDPIYVESTPTKLIEYMAGGLYVLASTGIPFQERVVTESGAGSLADFDRESMAHAIVDACGRRDALGPAGRRGFEYARRRLACEVFRDELDRALWGEAATSSGA